MDKKLKIIFVLCLLLVVVFSAALFGVKRSDAELSEVPLAVAVAEGAQKQISATSSGWQRRCVGEGEGQCELFQAIHMGAQGKSLLLSEVAISQVEQRGPKLGIFLPLGVTLTQGVALKIDENDLMQMPFNICNAKGCSAVSQITDAILSQLKSGNILNVYFFDGANKRVNVQFSLDGVTKGLRGL